MDRVSIIINAISDSYMPLIITTVATIITTGSFKLLSKIIRGDYDLPTIPKPTIPKINLHKRAKKENYDLPEKQKDFIQLN